MGYGIALLTNDRGITPAAAVKLAESHGFRKFYVPEHTHMPLPLRPHYLVTDEYHCPVTTAICDAYL